MDAVTDFTLFGGVGIQIVTRGSEFIRFIFRVSSPSDEKATVEDTTLSLQNSGFVL